MTEKHSGIDPVLLDALAAVRRFVEETTGMPPTPEELARALKRYFVLKEIKESVEMDREQPKPAESEQTEPHQ